MNVIWYGASPDKLPLPLWGRIQRTIPGIGLELHRSLPSLASRLRQPGGNIAIVVLYVADREVASNLLVMRPLLHDLPVVILLNDQAPEILRLSHELRPRVIMYTSWKDRDLCSVLQRCIRRSLSRNVWGKPLPEIQGTERVKGGAREGDKCES